MIDPQAKSILEPVLTPDERVLWAARPDPAAYACAARGHWLYAGILVFVGALLLAGGAGALIRLSPALALAPGLTLAALGIAGILGGAHRVVIIHRGSRTAYGLTDRRVLTATAGPKRLRAWTPLSRIVGVQTFGDEHAGAILLSAAHEDGRAAKLALALNAIHRPNEVEALLLDLLTPTPEAQRPAP